ncbi:unnamed protein product [Symbiodinium sp. CCMP2592]|nr:unnamed protein product [Symbiodinium sp. CCMP2592]
MLSDKEVRWIPWKYRLSARAQEDSLLVRPRKQAAASLRGPTTMEAQAADRRCWEIIADLVNVHHWKLDDALHEVAEVRSDLHSLFAPRPFIPKPKFDLDNSWKSRFTGNGRGGKGGGRGGKGRDGKGEKGERFERGHEGGKGKDNKQATPPGKWLSTIFVEGKRQTLCMRYQSGQCKDPSTCRYLHRCADTRFSDQRDSGTSLKRCHHVAAQAKAGAAVSGAATALSEGSLDFATCLELLAQYFSKPFDSSAPSLDPAIESSEAYFNLGAFAFDNGARSGIFQRTEQFSDVLRFLNACMQLQFPGATWSSLCISTLNHTVSLGNFSGGEVWLCPALSKGDRWVLTIHMQGAARFRLQVEPRPLQDPTNVELFLDLCCGEQLDILHDDTYDHLLRLCFSGIIRLAHGAHVSLEQPTNAMSWLEPFVQDMLSEIQASLPPTAAQDGGGIYSLPDWSLGPRYQSDSLRDLRKEWQQWLLEKQIPLRLQHHVANACNTPLFSQDETNWLRSSFKRFSDAHSPSQDWDFTVKEGQPQQERLFFYRVCPFGATFSSHWFARLGGFFVRCLRLLIWLSHVLMLYVDDLLLWQNSRLLPLSASLVLAFCSCFNIPLSWGKLQMGPSITWIGWQIDFHAGCYTLPDAKRLKLLSQVEECLRHRLVSRKQLDKLLGLLQWILHGLPALRPWLCTLYDDMHRPLGTNVSTSPCTWPGIHTYLDDKLRFTGCPPGTSISTGSTLLSARHKALRSKDDLAAVPVSTKRMWLRVADPTSSKRRLSESSRETLAFFAHLSSREWRPKPLRPPPTRPVDSAADAFGKGNDCGVGGWLRLPSGRLLWFSHRYTVSDFTNLGLPMQPDANLDISSYETLAQCFVLLAFWKAHGSGRLALTLPALSDNSGAESLCNKLYTSKVPLNLFVRKLSMWSSITGVTLDCSHISGEKNEDADWLSRWDGSADLPEQFSTANHIELSLSKFWHVSFQVTLCPPTTFLKWQLPAQHSLGPSNRGSNKRK